MPNDFGSYVQDITDPREKENQDRLRQDIEANVLNRMESAHVKFNFPGAGTYKIAHNLGFIVEDIIVTKSNGGSVTFNYSAFDTRFIDCTVAGAVDFRAFVGRFREEGR